MSIALPERATALRDTASSPGFLVAVALVVVLAAFLSILLLDRLGLSYGPDGESFGAYPTGGLAESP